MLNWLLDQFFELVLDHSSRSTVVSGDREMNKNQKIIQINNSFVVAVYQNLVAAILYLFNTVDWLCVIKSFSIPRNHR